MEKKTFEITFARIEHQVWRFEVDAVDEDQAQELAEKYMDSPEFDWDDYEVVHAEEFINGVDEV